MKKNLLTDFFCTASRHCPGSDEMTQKVLKQIHLKNPQPSIINLGFGTGDQTFLLVDRYKVPITAYEYNPNYAIPFAKKIEKQGLGDMIAISVCSIEKLPFEVNSFDLILSEGGIEYLNFSQRINLWKPFIKPGGYLALSELYLSTDKDIPEELYDYLESNFPWKDLDTIEYKENQIKEAGYRLCSRFIFPDDCWMHNYFREMQFWFEDLPEKKKESREGRTISGFIENAIYTYLTYKEYFGYVYFTLRKPE